MPIQRRSKDFSRKLRIGGRTGSRTQTALSRLRILSPMRLPVSPPGRERKYHHTPVLRSGGRWARRPGRNRVARTRGGVAPASGVPMLHRIDPLQRSAVLPTASTTANASRATTIPSAATAHRIVLFILHLLRSLPNRLQGAASRTAPSKRQSEDNDRARKGNPK